MENEFAPSKWLIFLLLLLWSLTLFAHVIAYIEYFTGPVAETHSLGFISYLYQTPNYFAESAFLSFMVSLIATQLVLITQFKKMVHWAQTELNGLGTKFEKSKVEVVNEFVHQMKHGARMVDVGHELQIAALYDDASHIRAYFPVHTVLREKAYLRRILAETMAKPNFVTYEMVVGRSGRKNLAEALDKWCDEIRELKARNQTASAARESANLITFLKKLTVRYDGRVNEPQDVRLSFFHVVLGDGVKRRGVIYVWAPPFGYDFNDVNGALIIEGDSTYLGTLYDLFKKATIDTADITSTLRHDAMEKLYSCIE